MRSGDRFHVTAVTIGRSIGACVLQAVRRDCSIRRSSRLNLMATFVQPPIGGNLQLICQLKVRENWKGFGYEESNIGVSDRRHRRLHRHGYSITG